jgi:hypothetical protein
MLLEQPESLPKLRSLEVSLGIGLLAFLIFLIKSLTATLMIGFPVWDSTFHFTFLLGMKEEMAFFTTSSPPDPAWMCTTLKAGKLSSVV